MSLPENLQMAFGNRVREALNTFANTNGQCVSLCAYISARLTDDGIENKVALGSLLCNGVRTFEYAGPIPTKPSKSPQSWDGHAWLEFPGGIIGEPSLFRTARAALSNSNLRQTLDAYGLLERGALMIAAASALTDYGLYYQQVAYLEESAYIPLIGGLMAMNNLGR